MTVLLEAALAVSASESATPRGASDSAGDSNLPFKESFLPLFERFASCLLAPPSPLESFLTADLPASGKLLLAIVANVLDDR